MKHVLITNKEDLHKLMEYAKQLPQDASTPIYQDFNGNVIWTYDYSILYDETMIPADIFNAAHLYRRVNSYPRYYVRSHKTDEDGKILPKKVYRHELMIHHKYARHDVPIKHVSFEVVGFKRKSTLLPAGVLIRNLVFYTENDQDSWEATKALSTELKKSDKFYIEN